MLVAACPSSSTAQVDRSAHKSHARMQPCQAEGPLCAFYLSSPRMSCLRGSTNAAVWRSLDLASEESRMQDSRHDLARTRQEEATARRYSTADDGGDEARESQLAAGYVAGSCVWVVQVTIAATLVEGASRVLELRPGEGCPPQPASCQSHTCR